MKLKYFTTKPSQTKKTGEDLAREILRTVSSKPSFVVGLEGELGSGKTTFLQGFARGLKIKEKILSPSFVIMKKFSIPEFKLKINSKVQPPQFKNFYHIDCYRARKPKEILDLGFKEIIADPKNIVAIEWADRIYQILPKEILILKFEFIDKYKRKIVVE